MDNEILEPIGKGLMRSWKLKRIITQSRTKFQLVTIAETEQGISLFCDADRQSTEMTQQIYHDAMIWPALLTARLPLRNALIVGSSEGVVPCMLRDTQLCCPNNVFHVDIDEECVRLCAKYLPYGYTKTEVEQLYDTNNLIFEDGNKYLQENGGLWDLICVDLPDAIADEVVPQNTLYDLDFLRLAKSRMTDEGVYITQAGCPTAWRNETLKRTWTKMRAVFPHVKYWHCPEHEWSWMLGYLKEPHAWSLPADKAIWPKTIHPKSIDGSFSIPSCLNFHESTD